MFWLRKRFRELEAFAIRESNRRLELEQKLQSFEWKQEYLHEKDIGPRLQVLADKIERIEQEIRQIKTRLFVLEKEPRNPDGG
jgi:hypothetical protein